MVRMLGPQPTVRVSKKICGKNIKQNYAERGWGWTSVSRHKSIHTKLRVQLSPEIVEKMLFVRYNAKKLGDHAFPQFSQAGPDEWYFEELEPDKASET